MQRIAIAVVQRDGCYLVGRRGDDVPLPGYAEFPGGKCEPGEDSAACAVRECREETGIGVVALRSLFSCEHEYAHGRLALEFWLCHPVDATAAPAGGYRWIAAESLRSLRFPEANQGIIALLTGGPPSAT